MKNKINILTARLYLINYYFYVSKASKRDQVEKSDKRDNQILQSLNMTQNTACSLATDKSC